MTVLQQLLCVFEQKWKLKVVRYVTQKVNLNRDLKAIHWEWYKENKYKSRRHKLHNLIYTDKMHTSLSLQVPKKIFKMHPCLLHKKVVPLPRNCSLNLVHPGCKRNFFLLNPSKFWCTVCLGMYGVQTWLCILLTLVLWPGDTTSKNMAELVWTVKLKTMTLWAYTFHPVHIFTHFLLHVHFISQQILVQTLSSPILCQYFTMSFHLTFCSPVMSNSIHNFSHFISIAWKASIADRIIYNFI